VLAPVAILGAAGCAGPPGPREAAERLAADLADGTFDSATLADAADAEQSLAALLGNLSGLPRTVAVGEIRDSDQGDDVRSVDLAWTWDLGDGADPWVVDASAEMELVDDRWVTRWSPTLVHPDATAEASLTLAVVDAERGEIVGPDAAAIVTDRPVLQIGIDKTTVPDAAAAASAGEQLAARLGFEDPAAFAERVAAAGASAFVVAITVRQDEAERWDVDELRTLPGVLVRSDELPLAPTSTFARPILGTVGDATAEIIEESDGAIVRGQQVGLSGLQRAYDDRLRGRPGRTVVLRTDETQEELYRSTPEAGSDLTVTLDTRLQTLAEDVLAGVEPASAIVAVQPSTGHVVAAASGPGSAGLNTATLGLFPPGSTFKIATSLALLRQGFTTESPVECSPTITVEGRQFTNYPGYPAGSLGEIPLREAIAQSCNTALIAQHEELTGADLASAARALGIAAPGTWPFPYASGSVPDDSEGTDHAASLIGQGRVVASPMAMAVAAASVAQGSTVTPVLVVGEGPQDAAAPDAPLTAAEAASLRDLMREVVETGSSTFLQDVPGEPVSAKSGTAQYGTTDPPATNAWMIAYQGDLAVAVFVEVGEYGTATAGPLLEEFLRGVPG
jgi:cell division protein FtsI/penicillin-binding protein 2